MVLFLAFASSFKKIILPPWLLTLILGFLFHKFSYFTPPPHPGAILASYGQLLHSSRQRGGGKERPG